MSSAPTARRALRIRASLLVAATLALLVLAPASASAAPPFFTDFGDSGSAATGQLTLPRGIAANSANGHLYVADQGNDRVVEFSAWGEFVRTWGWDVVATGSPNNQPNDEVQEVTISGAPTGGTFTMRLGGTATATEPIAFNASPAEFEDGLETSSAIAPGDVAVTSANPGGGAAAGGPYTVEFGGSLADADLVQLAGQGSGLSPSGSIAVTTTVPGAAFEVCVPADGDTCKAGARGSGPGHLWNPQGVAVDSAGDVYVVDWFNDRLQKFSATGELVWMLGGGVNQGGGSPANPGDICTAEHLANGDTCGAGAPGSGPGQFDFPSVGDYVTVDAGDEIWVADEGRVQRFDAGGAHLSEFALPGEVLASLAADPLSANLYAAYSTGTSASSVSKPDVRVLSPTGAELEAIEVDDPRAIAVEPDGDLWVTDGVTQKGVSPMEIHAFDPGGNLLETIAGSDFDSSNGIAASPVTAAGDIALYVVNSSSGSTFSIADAFIRAYSPLPDTSIVGPPPSVPPSIAGAHAASVTTEEATLRAQINPLFWDDATYQVEYGAEGPCSANPCQEAPVSPQALTAQVINAPLPAEVSLAGLGPDTTYHYRFVAQSGGDPDPAFGPDLTFHTYPETAGLATDCPNQAFRTGPGALLPDCRSYEMVSPVDKNGSDIHALSTVSNIEQFRVQSDPQGEGLAYSASSAFAGAQSSPHTSQYLASRGAGGWSTEAITPPRDTNISDQASNYLRSQFLTFSEDLTTSWLFWDGDPPLHPAVPAGYRSLYRRDNESDDYTPLSTVTPPTAPPGTGTGAFNSILQGFSADGSHAVFSANDRLLASASIATDSAGNPIVQLYEHRDGEPLRLVSVLPEGGASDENSSAGSVPPTALAGNYDAGHATNAVSADGSVIWWASAGKLYARVDGIETVEVSETVSAAEAHFWTAAADGSAALFTIGSDLYLFDRASEASALIASGVEGSVGGVVGASEDLSNAYLASTEVLDSAPNSEGDTAIAGESNLFHWQEGEGLSFVATLADNEVDAGDPGVANLSLVKRVSRVSPDGRHLVFMSRAPLTGYDNTLQNGVFDPPFEPTLAAPEVFRYAADTDQLDCVSCNPTGARPVGVALDGLKGRGDSGLWWNLASVIPGHKSHFYATRVLSDDGSRVFFESFDSLLPRDTNGAMDVYMWQAPDTGSCDTDNSNPGPLYFEANGGCLALISTGRSEGDSDFVDATPDGETVFLRTLESLVARDSGLTDIYAARVGGGFPEPPPAAPCSGEECRGASSSAPSPAGAGSAVFSGPGNPTAHAGSRCSRFAKVARKRSRAAKRLRSRARRTLRGARRSSSTRRSRASRRRAKRLLTVARKRARIARRQASRAKRCRRARANPNRRAAR